MLDRVVLGQRPGSRGAPEPAARQGADGRTEPRAATVLIIEDDAIIAMAVAEELAQNGIQVVGPAATGQEAIDLAQQYRPDLMIVDVRLRGEMNGIVATRRIKQTMAPHVVFASAHIDAVTRAAMDEVGYYAIVPKPYTPEQLVRVVREALDD